RQTTRKGIVYVLLVVHRWTSAARRLPCAAFLSDLTCPDFSQRHDGCRYSAHQQPSTGDRMEAWGKAVCPPHCLTGYVGDLPCFIRRYGSANRTRTTNGKRLYPDVGRCATEHQRRPAVHVWHDARYVVVFRDDWAA